MGSGPPLVPAGLNPVPRYATVKTMIVTVKPMKTYHGPVKLSVDWAQKPAKMESGRGVPLPFQHQRYATVRTMIVTVKPMKTYHGIVLLHVGKAERAVKTGSGLTVRLQSPAQRYAMAKITIATDKSMKVVSVNPEQFVPAVLIPVNAKKVSKNVSQMDNGMKSARVRSSPSQSSVTAKTTIATDSSMNP